MKIYSTLFFILFIFNFPGIGYAQNPNSDTTYYENKGRSIRTITIREGNRSKTTEYNKKGKLSSVKSFEDNLPSGKQYFYDFNGKEQISYTCIILQDSSGIKRSVIHGPYISRDSSVVGYYRYGKREGTWIEKQSGTGGKTVRYYDNEKGRCSVKLFQPDGKLYQEVNYKCNCVEETKIGDYDRSCCRMVYDGLYTMYNAVGISSQGLYKSGQYEGMWRRYDKSGLLQSEINYKNGLYNGNYILFDEKGNIKQKQFYIIDSTKGKKESVLDGESFNNNGTTTSKGYYTRGVTNGVFLTWNNKGQKIAESHYKNGEEFFFKKWYEDGALKTESSYETDETDSVKWKNSTKNYYPNGVLESVNCFDKKGKTMVKELYYLNGKTGQVIYDLPLIKLFFFYYPNGQRKKMKCSLAANENTGLGTYLEWYMNGKLKSLHEEKYINAEYIETDVKWYSNGDLGSFFQTVRDKEKRQMIKKVSNPEAIAHIYSELYSGIDTTQGTNETKNGHADYWYNRERKFLSIDLKNGSVTGKVILWYPEGQTMVEGEIDNKQNANMKILYNNGVLKEEIKNIK
jgi:antitoxin component YwqK of YwqJK toxin-antitoxin module